MLCVRWYLTFKLSSRDLVQMMAERGILLAHTTILRWVQRYVPDFEKRWQAYAETYSTVGRSLPLTLLNFWEKYRERSGPDCGDGGLVMRVLL